VCVRVCVCVCVCVCAYAHEMFGGCPQIASTNVLSVNNSLPFKAIRGVVDSIVLVAPTVSDDTRVGRKLGYHLGHLDPLCCEVGVTCRHRLRVGRLLIPEVIVCLTGSCVSVEESATRRNSLVDVQRKVVPTVTTIERAVQSRTKRDRARSCLQTVGGLRSQQETPVGHISPE
jgi:hypothetical protein